MRSHLTSTLVALPLVAFLAGVAPLAAQQPAPAPQAAPAQQAKPFRPLSQQMDETQNPADKAFLGAMHDMMVGMHRSMPTGDTDRDFVALMLPQHQSAVDMAKAEVLYGVDPGLKTLAQTIVDDQQREIALMKAWQDKYAR